MHPVSLPFSVPIALVIVCHWALFYAVLKLVRHWVVMLALWASPLLAFARPVVIRLRKAVSLADLDVAIVPEYLMML